MRRKPNILIDTTQKLRDREAFKEFVLQVNKETFVYQFRPNSIFVEDGVYFTLNLNNKRFIIDILEVDNIKDYIDIYLYGVKQPQNRYEVLVDGNNIIVTFVADITRLPNEVSANDFGKWFSDTSAIFPTLLCGALLIALATSRKFLRNQVSRRVTSRRASSIATYALLSVPFLVTLFYFYRYINLLLPAGA